MLFDDVANIEDENGGEVLASLMCVCSAFLL